MSAELTCRKCGYAGPQQEFRRNKNTALGVENLCKRCNVATSRAWKARNPERSREHHRKADALERAAQIKSGEILVPKGGCYACACVKPDAEFVSSKGKRRNICKQCANRRQREWFRDHPEVRRNWQLEHRDKVRAASKRWRERHPGAQEESQKRAYAALRADSTKRRFWTDYYRRFMQMRRSGAVASDAMLLELVEKCVSDLPEDVREAAQQDLFLRVLSHDLRRSELRRGTDAVKSAIAHAYIEVPGRFGHRSLDTPVYVDAELSWADLIEDETDYGG